jgi:hypothetical protein
MICLFVSHVLAAASGAVDEASFEEAFHATPAITVRIDKADRSRYIFSLGMV